MAMPMTSHTTDSAGSLRRRTVAVPVACSACSTQLLSRLCAKSEKLASELAAPAANNAAATSIAAPFQSTTARRSGGFTIAACGHDAVGAGGGGGRALPGDVVTAPG